MILNNFEDYEVLSILGSCNNSTVYEVRNKQTLHTYTWKSVSFAHLTQIEKQNLLEDVERKKASNDKHILPIYNHIIQDEHKILYVIGEFCANGNLHSIIQRSLIENKYLHENLLWKIMYQIAKAMKRNTGSLTINNVFLDANYNIKIFDANKLTEENNLDVILYQMTTLKLTKPSDFKEAFAEIPNYYSLEFCEMLKFILSTTTTNTEIIEAVLCHPTIFLKSSQVPDVIYITDSKVTTQTIMTQDTISRFENLKNRETAVKQKEERLQNKENELRKREKKIALIERTIQDKMLHAEVYLKRCRHTKSLNSDSNKVSYENIESSIVVDSPTQLRTSKKLDTNNIKKPSNFTRTLSHRQVHFKGHSPLKDMFSKNVRDHVIHKGAADHTSKSKKKLDLSLLPENRKPLIDKNRDCRPTSWSEEAKRHAFDLLRIINHTQDDKVLQKHTYL